jgi:type IV secretory pathway VirB3-like protein
MHTLGILGIPRRIFDIPIIYTPIVYIESLGVILMYVAHILFILAILVPTSINFDFNFNKLCLKYGIDTVLITFLMSLFALAGAYAYYESLSN